MSIDIEFCHSTSLHFEQNKSWIGGIGKPNTRLYFHYKLETASRFVQRKKETACIEKVDIHTRYFDSMQMAA